MTEENFDKDYWNSKWENAQTGWDIGSASTAISEYFLQVENKNVKILIPGCGNAHEAELLLEEGFKNITLLDIAPKACEIISKKFSHHEVNVICEDFFNHNGKYDIIVEQTFFCALHRNLREKYVEKMDSLLHENGKIKSREITIAHELPDIYVVSNGLQENEKFLLEGVQKVKDNQQVQIKFVNPQEVFKSLKIKAN